MSNRQSEGIVQVWDNSVQAINDALATVTNRLDHLKGLRGRTLTYDRIRAEDPTSAQDVLTRGSLSLMTQVVFVCPPCATVAIRPGVSLFEWNTGLRKKYNFSGGQITAARLIFNGWGTETGSKRLLIGNGDTNLCEVTWSGSNESIVTSDTNALDNFTSELPLRVHCALSSASESLILSWLVLELLG